MELSCLRPTALSLPVLPPLMPIGSLLRNRPVTGSYQRMTPLRGSEMEVVATVSEGEIQVVMVSVDVDQSRSEFGRSTHSFSRVATSFIRTYYIKAGAVSHDPARGVSTAERQSHGVKVKA